MSLVIIDTGCANLSSVAFAFERLGVSAIITDNADLIKSADRVILPGVGSAPFAMNKIREKGLVDLIQNLSQPVIGICLGMQLLFETLSEGGEVIDGLGLVPGHVGLLDTEGLPSPHMGWNTLNLRSENPLTVGLQNGDYAYFVHSYHAIPEVKENVLAYTHYGIDIPAIVHRNNVFGVQFHPEKSHNNGLTVLKNFAELTL